MAGNVNLINSMSRPFSDINLNAFIIYFMAQMFATPSRPEAPECQLPTAARSITKHM